VLLDAAGGFLALEVNEDVVSVVMGEDAS